jgi:phage baseplate assembly protein W
MSGVSSAFGFFAFGISPFGGTGTNSSPTTNTVNYNASGTNGAVTAANVNSSSWSLALDATIGQGPGSGIGSIVQAYDDINQCISIILTTHPGEDPLRPTFGLDMHDYIDKPLPVTQSVLTGLVVNAITLWEPRVQVVSVNVNVPQSYPGSLSVVVNWQLNILALGPNPSLFGGQNGTFQQQTTSVVLV